jgi:hypothetical protein
MRPDATTSEAIADFPTGPLRGKLPGHVTPYVTSGTTPHDPSWCILKLSTINNDGLTAAETIAQRSTNHVRSTTDLIRIHP